MSFNTIQTKAHIPYSTHTVQCSRRFIHSVSENQHQCTLPHIYRYMCIHLLFCQASKHGKGKAAGVNFHIILIRSKQNSSNRSISTIYTLYLIAICLSFVYTRGWYTSLYVCCERSKMSLSPYIHICGGIRCWVVHWVE